MLKYIDKNLIYIFIILTSVSLLRIYNLNYESFWIDEILSFWIADPNLSLNQTIDRHNDLEQVPILFNFILKYFFKIFEYNHLAGRYLTSFFNIFSLILCLILISEITNNKKSVLFFSILICFNIYLFKYSQELRVYSLLFLLTSLSSLYFVKITKNDSKFNYLLFFIFTLLSILSHPFALIVFFSMITYSLVISYNRRIINKLNITLFILLILSFCYYLIYFLNLNEITSWIPQVDIKFFTNYFFSKFFGSRILGIIYLIIFLYLIFVLREKIINSILLFFLFIVLYSYILPIIFSLFVKPILIDRYIIFVILPVLLLISILIFYLENNIVKKSFISILIITTLVNFSFENPIKQFFEQPKKNKPDFNQSLNIIQKSNDRLILIKNFMPYSSEKRKFYRILDISVNHYLTHLANEIDPGLKIITKDDLNTNKISNIWVLCYSDLDIDNCKLPKFGKKVLIEKNIFLSKINLKKIKIDLSK